MPEFAKLLDDSFRQNKWVYVPVAERLDEPHLRDFHPAEAPTFRWPPAVVEAFHRIEAERASNRRKKQRMNISLFSLPAMNILGKRRLEQR